MTFGLPTLLCCSTFIIWSVKVSLLTYSEILLLQREGENFKILWVLICLLFGEVLIERLPIELWQCAFKRID